MGDHTETVQVDYDPNRISYKQLQREIDLLGLSENGQRVLEGIVK